MLRFEQEEAEGALNWVLARYRGILAGRPL